VLAVLLFISVHGGAQTDVMPPDVPAAAPAVMLPRMEKSLVMIRSVSQAVDPATPWKDRSMSQGIGTGFIIEGHRILTNAHNVSDVKYVEVKKQDQAQRWPAIVMYVAHDCDLAMLTVLDKAFFEGTLPLELGELPENHSTVQTYGFPVGGRQISVTEGVVSRVETTCIPTRRPIPTWSSRPTRPSIPATAADPSCRTARSSASRSRA